MAVDQQRWIRRFRPRKEAEAVLLCFPHAGGAASAYFALATSAPTTLEAQVVQYPGRQERRAEPCLERIEELARCTADALDTEGRPVALFGHSMGALVAFETARVLEDQGVSPVAVFVSGRGAPCVGREDKPLHQWSDDEVVAELTALGGTGGTQLANEDILRMTLPALRGDYAALCAYRPEPGVRVACPINAFVGDADQTTPVSDAARWREHTTGDFDLHVFRGGHFYLNEHLPDVLRRVTASLAAAPTP